MGIVQPYFPAEMAVKLAKIAKAETFIETGTYMGGTAKLASTLFKTVHTIEWSKIYFNQVKDELLSKGNIIPYLGDSRKILVDILIDIKDSAVFWLDAHYSMPDSAGKDDPCPLLKELEIILSRDCEDIILIDDARYLLDERGWPTIFEIYTKIMELPIRKKHIAICDDNVYIVPDDDKYKKLLLGYVLERGAYLWKEDYQKKNPDKIIFMDSVINLLKKIGLYKIARKIYRNM
jgi:hypothetical protein